MDAHVSRCNTTDAHADVQTHVGMDVHMGVHNLMFMQGVHEDAHVSICNKTDAHVDVQTQMGMQMFKRRRS